MGARIERNRPSAAGEGQALDPTDVAGLGHAARADDPRVIDEQVRLGRRVADRVTAGKRVTADEPQAGLVGPSDDRPLRACDVGHRRAIGDLAAERSGQLGEQVETGQRRGGQDDQLGAMERLGQRPRGPIEDPIRERGVRPDRAAAPGDQLDPLAHRRRRLSPAERAGDRAADEPEADDRDPHGPDHRRSRSPPRFRNRKSTPS